MNLYSVVTDEMISVITFMTISRIHKKPNPSTGIAKEIVKDMGKINTTLHDNFIRAILADKEIAREYFSNYLPSFVSNHLDLSTLTQMPDTYLSKNLRKTMSDIIYTCTTKNGEENVKVSLLIEHKSYADKYTPIQIGSYIFSGLEKQVANKEKLSIIIPVLLYHGKEKWQYATLSDSLRKFRAILEEICS